MHTIIATFQIDSSILVCVVFFLNQYTNKCISKCTMFTVLHYEQIAVHQRVHCTHAIVAKIATR